MLNKLKKSNKESGFTIIEVMIVLAIAGLIILIVLLAVPALQRNGRNTALKNDAAAVAAALSEFRSNNDGTLPTVDAANIAVDASGNATIKGAASASNATAKLQSGTTLKGVASAKPTSALANSSIEVHKGQTCSGDTTTRGLTVWYQLEAKGGPVTANNKCIDA